MALDPGLLLVRQHALHRGMQRLDVLAQSLRNVAAAFENGVNVFARRAGLTRGASLFEDRAERIQLCLVLRPECIAQRRDFGALLVRGEGRPCWDLHDTEDVRRMIVDMINELGPRS
jgi:hypothetical protein